VRLAAIAADLVWAFGLKGADGAPLALPEPSSPKATARLLRDLEGAFGRVRPIASAPSIGEVVAALRATGPPAPARVRRRLVAELDALVAQGTHGRAKRQERKRVLGEIVLVFGLEGALGIAPAAAAEDERLAAVSRAVATILER
jgi:hypothetical protein